MELTSPTLAEALLNRVQFTQEELDLFGVVGLERATAWQSYIEASNGRYYKPAARTCWALLQPTFQI